MTAGEAAATTPTADAGARRSLVATGAETGTVTAELALGLPAVVAVLAVVLVLASGATTQLRCADAARAGARAAALGEGIAEVQAVAGRLAGTGAAVRVQRSGTWVTVTVRHGVAAGPLATTGLVAEGRATARVEP